MKQAFYVILILGLIYFCYWYITKPQDIIEVKGDLTVLQNSNSDIDAPQVSRSSYKAKINGSASNTGNFTVKAIWITYKIGVKEVEAYISELAPGQTVNFRTGACVVKYNNPDFKLISVKYSK